MYYLGLHLHVFTIENQGKASTIKI